ncbi:MAG: hypothetical protein ACTSYE_07300, partial [Alphaproteobacteria bacterium]
PGEGYFALDRFALGDVVLPARRAVQRAIRGGGQGGELTTQLGSLDIAGLDFRSFAWPRAQLTELRMVLDDYVGRIPSTVEMNVRGLKFGVALIGDREARAFLTALGYEEIDADFGFTFAWDPQQRSVTVDDVRFTMRDLGTVQGEARFEGLLGDTFDNLAVLEDRLGTIEFAGGKFTFHDDSIVTRGLAMQAARMQVETEVFREQIASALPFMISFLGTPAFQREIVPVLQAFIREPGDLTIAAEPSEPVALSSLRTALSGAPQTLPDLLSVSVTGDTAASFDDIGTRPTIAIED